MNYAKNRRQTPKKRKREEAEIEAVQADDWKCKTCDAPVDDRYALYCIHCGIYWQDVDNGLFN